MDWKRLAGVVATAGVALAAAGLAVSLLLDNELLRGGPWTTPALVGLVVALGYLVVLVAMGGQGRRWTPYW